VSNSDILCFQLQTTTHKKGGRSYCNMSELMIRTTKVLQLNAAYEPDRIIDAVHAVVLVHHRHKAQAVEIAPGQFIRSSRITYETPSVIRLVEYHDVRRKRRESGKLRLHIFIRDGLHCLYCGLKLSPSELTLDHIQPQSRGGTDAPENLATSCYPCNQQKGNRTPAEARMALRATPSSLRYGLDKALLRHLAQTRTEWRPYLFLDTAPN
jgi:5-methylcytosine-specific restriction endonuclease McrA